MSVVLAADIGGTSSRFARFAFEQSGPPKLLDRVTFASQEVQTFQNLLAQVGAYNGGQLVRGLNAFVLAITGPVKNGTYSHSGSLHWDVDLERDKSSLFDCPTWLINDFLAQAFATLSPIAETVETILPGSRQDKTTVTVVGAGTGLGIATLVPDDQGNYIGCPSEGGHGSFAAESSEEFEFWQFSTREISSSYLEWEDVLSGRGLSLVHQYFSGEKLTPAEVAAVLPKYPKTTEFFARVYGRFCRNRALESLPYSGLFIAGGVAAKNPRIVQCEAFQKSFLSSKSYREVLESIPVYLFDEEDSGLWGAAWFGRERLSARMGHGG